MQLMILAAGEGTRLRPYTLKRAKPLMPLLGLPMVCYGLEHFYQLPPTKIAFNTFHLSEQVASRLLNLLKAHFPESEIKHFHDGDFIKGNGGGLRLAKDFFDFDDEIILMNSDEVFLPQDPEYLQKALEQHRGSGALATLLVTENPEVGTKFGGVWSNDHRTVKGFGKTALDHCHGYHFIGMQILSPKIFNYLPPDKELNIIYDGLVHALEENQKVEIMTVKGDWFETGNPADFQSCQETLLGFLKKKLNPQFDQLKSLMMDYGNLTESEFNHSLEILTKHDSWVHPRARGFGKVLGRGNVLSENAVLGDSAVTGSVFHHQTIDTVVDITMLTNEFQIHL